MLQQVKARAHEEEKLDLVTGGIALSLVALWLWRGGGVEGSQSRAATRSRVPTAMAMAHKFSGSQVAVFPKVFRYQETIEPMIPGRPAAAVPAKLARARPKAWRCYFTHSFKLPLSDDLGDVAVAGTLPPPPVSASTRVEIAIPTAVRMDTIVTPCSRKRVRMRSASVVSSWRIRLNVSRILLIWDRRAALFAESASS